jgi:hypothetical protein
MYIIIWAMTQTVHHLSDVWVHYKVLPIFYKRDENIEDWREGSTRSTTRYGESLPAEPLSINITKKYTTAS